MDLITAYTAEGVIFAVDTRLRPNGREGTLVQTASFNYNEYLSNGRKPGRAYLYEVAGVAGNVSATRDFLHELQQVDWRRYGQSGRSRHDLREMRARLEREQGATEPVESGTRRILRY